MCLPTNIKLLLYFFPLKYEEKWREHLAGRLGPLASLEEVSGLLPEAEQQAACRVPSLQEVTEQTEVLELGTPAY